MKLYKEVVTPTASPNISTLNYYTQLRQQRNFLYCQKTNNSDGKASLKRQKLPETTTDTQDVSKFDWFYV